LWNAKPEIRPEYWDYIINEDFMLNFFTDLEFLRNEMAAIQEKKTRTLAV
jgi:hypothetical protein